MSGSLRLDDKFPTIEQEAPGASHPTRPVQIFVQDKHVFLRVGPVEGVNPAHGSYTLLLTAENAVEIGDALHDLGRELDQKGATAKAPEIPSLQPEHNTW